MKYFSLILTLLLAAVNVILLWQIYRKVKTAPADSEVTDIKPFLMGRLTAFAVNTVFIAVLFVLYQVLNILDRY